MTDTQLRAQEEWASPLFTPRERELMRELKELQQRSAAVIERLAYATRPKEFLHHFPSLPSKSKNPPH